MKVDDNGHITKNIAVVEVEVSRVPNPSSGILGYDARAVPVTQVGFKKYTCACVYVCACVCDQIHLSVSFVYREDLRTSL